jgi:dipeptidyl aminopeptidase/acylaminoacyl peptidase
VKTVCAYCGVFDLVRYREQPLLRENQPLADIIAKYLGGPIEQRLDLARLVSPITYVNAHSPPFFLLHGDADAVVPISESERFHGRLLQAGVDSTFRVVPGGGHGWGWSLTSDEVVAFFKRTL